ncbi:hypothetical protein HU675_0050085 (plasmid) [Bradyrhizobium septentrionale]|uniref:hypothetical protein n=1 Tax=Bradyrhizobium septentrionale TaxID=1404411 RepID=UPI00159677EF|nr:hypothetical protein [Bradyrhizobium septentrionale]UGY30265.1 hypothetical protein HU675_0049975 [Bradyrhizobium septentrionale]UGY30279.1 hypothetical protein HU675_0050085 [Bradyrhizobium septentrionale]
MLGAIERLNVAGVDPLDNAAHRQLSPSSPSVSLRGARAPEATTTQSLAHSVNGAPNSALLGTSVPELVTQQTLSGIAPKLEDFATGSNMSAIAALIVRVNSELRKAAREDMWAAVGADIAAQDAAAKSIRSSGLYQLIGSIVASSGAIAGAGMNIKGARESQLLFESNAPKAPSGLRARASDGMSIEAPSGLSARTSDYHTPDDRSIETPSGLSARTSDYHTPDDRSIEAPSGLSARTSDYHTPDDRSIEAPSGLGAHTPDDMVDFDFMRMANAQTAAQQATMKWGGMAAIATETSKIAGAGMNMASTQCQEEKVKHDADSTKAKAQAEDERQFIDYYQTQIQDMLSKLAEIRSADSETRSKLVNMA